MPGTTPPKNKAPMDAPATEEYTTIGIDGGIIIPIVEDAAVTPTDVSFVYPSSSIAGIRIEPMPAVSA